MSEVTCRGCGYSGETCTFEPCITVYQDIRCPKCGSTNNAHNDEYQSRLFRAMNGESGNTGESQ